MDVVRFAPRDRDGLWEPWVNEQVVAHHFGVSNRTVRRWRERGMPSRLIGGSRRYRISACESWHDRKEPV